MDFRLRARRQSKNVGVQVQCLRIGYVRTRTEYINLLIANNREWSGERTRRVQNRHDFLVTFGVALASLLDRQLSLLVTQLRVRAISQQCLCAHDATRHDRTEQNRTDTGARVRAL